MSQHHSENPSGHQLEEFDRVLLEEDALVPSSGFAASVMDAIHQQSTAPAPIPFPWKKALPGLAILPVGIAAICWLAIFVIRRINQMSSTEMDWSSWQHWNSTSETATLFKTEAGPILLALAVSWLSVLLCRRLTRERSLR
jgi:hypothetical protein